MSKRRKTLQELRDFRHGLSVKARFRLLEYAIEDRASSLELLGYDDYASYLKSVLWSRTRQKVYKRANGRCEACGVRRPVNVHHWSYSLATMMGKNLQNLEAVCKECHDQFHEEPVRGTKTGRRLTPTQQANQAYYALVRAGGILAKPADMTPRLVKKRSA